MTCEVPGCTRKRRTQGMCGVHRAKAAKPLPRVPAGETREHVLRLRSLGWSRAETARIAEVSDSAIRDIERGQETVLASTAAAILAIEPELRLRARVQCARPSCTRARWGEHLQYCYVHHARARAAGEVGFVDSARVLSRLDELIEMGWTIADISRAAGMAHQSVWQILRHRRSRVRASTARAVLSVTPRRMPTPVGAVRRVQALARMGWSADHVAERAGVSRGAIAMAMWRGPSVSLSRRIAEVYEEMAGRQGPSAAARHRAVGAGWPPPLAWDNIDDPHEKPQGVRRPA